MLPCFVSCLLIPACVSWINPCLVVLTVCTLFGLLLMILDYPSSQALWKLFADQRPTLALELLFVLPVLYLFADVLTQPVFLTKSWNKACKLSRTSHVIVRPVTEYSATQGSSSFSEEHWPGMDTAHIL